MQINAKKTEVVVKLKTLESVTSNIFLDGDSLKKVRSFVYLGYNLSADGRSHEDICDRKSKVKSANSSLNRYSATTSWFLAMRHRLWRCYILPNLLYECEPWTIRETERRKLAVLEKRFPHSMLRINWTDKVSNREVLVLEAGQRCLLNYIVERIDEKDNEPQFSAIKSNEKS